MAVNAPALYLVCYDIADPRRLVRVHRYLKEHAVPVQYSVFVTRMRAMDHIRANLDRYRQSRAEPSNDRHIDAVLRAIDRACAGQMELPL